MFSGAVQGRLWVLMVTKLKPGYSRKSSRGNKLQLKYQVISAIIEEGKIVKDRKKGSLTLSCGIGKFSCVCVICSTGIC